MNPIAKKIVQQSLVYLLIIILSISMGLFISLKNTNADFITELDFDEISAPVKVYRDEFGIPTIIAENQEDLFFAQGFEYAKDRLWQAEFTRSVANGELSRLFGEDLIDADKFLRNLRLKEAAVLAYERSSSDYKGFVDRYVDGLNKYIDLTKNNLPLEFQILNANSLTSGDFKPVGPKKWTATDVFAIQGVMAYDLSYYVAERELLRQDLAVGLGVEKTLELMPILNQEAEDYFLSLDSSYFDFSNFQSIKSSPKFKTLGLDFGGGSNNWIISENRTSSGYSIIANDPHLGLSTPSIWWQVHLYSKDGQYHTQGYALPGVPGITIGHNEYLAWGMTNTGTDSIDLFYFNERTNGQGTQYFLDGEWKDIVIDSQIIEVRGKDDVKYDIEMTEYGPILNTDVLNITGNRRYAMRWVLNDGDDREKTFDAIFKVNTAKNADEFHAALKTFGVPGQNLVYATIDGDIGYQYTGLTPIRRTPGSGILPQNGSDPNFGWDGYVPYAQHLNITNPLSGFFATANEKVDKRDLFYITDTYENDNRITRIYQMMGDNTSVSVSDVETMQSDVLNLYANDTLNPIMPDFRDFTFTSDISLQAEEALSIFENWDFKMDIDSVGAAIFATFRIYLEEFTFKDEIDSVSTELYEDFESSARYLMEDIANKPNSIWYNNTQTSDTETRSDIVQAAFEEAIRFLDNNYGDKVEKWTWGRLHKVYFAHPIGTNAPIVDFNEGGKANSGSDHTVKASGGSPRWSENGPLFNQTHGQSMRLIAVAEPTWEQVYGILAPGESGNYGSPNRGDSVNDWIITKNHLWSFSITISAEPTFTFKKK